MRLAGMQPGRRRLSVLGLAAAAAMLPAVVAWRLGADWVAVLLLAGLGGGLLVALATIAFELRRRNAVVARRLAAQEDQLQRTREVLATVDRSAEAREQAVWEYVSGELRHEPDTFVLYRIIGNDLPPRHRSGQTLENLRFIVEHEPPLPGCQKRWVVNRIADPAVEKQVISLLEQHGMPYLHIPFDAEGYRRVGWRFDGFPVPGFTYRREFDTYSPMQQQWALDHVYHDKNLYVMNNNGARNAALREGRGLAKWVLPWDGNCFLTRQAWDGLVAAVTARPYLKYFTVPMARILDNEALLRPDLDVAPTEEPQLLFRRDVREEFDPRARYGRCPKVELFWRLGIVGPWDRWCRGPWDPVRTGLSTEAGQVGEAGWVARLYSGAKELERDTEARGWQRSEAVRAYIDRIDERLAAGTFDASAPVTLDLATLDRQRQAWRSGEPGPSRVVGELIAAAERTDDATVAALAFAVTREDRFACRAAELFRAHFESPRSRHAPSLHHLLDAARLLEAEAALAPAEVGRLRAWLTEHREWLRDSDEGRAARAALDHQGTWYDVEVAAIDAYLGDLPGLLATLRRSHERLGQQFDMDGGPNLAVQNLRGWVVLAWLAERAGHELSPRLVASIEAVHGDPHRLAQVLEERDGIRPFWSLGLRRAPGGPNRDG